MRPVLVALSVLFIVATGPGASAQDSGDSTVRLLYSPKNQLATELQATLEKHFEGITTTKFFADKQANLLSIRAGSKAGLDDVLQALAMIDKLPRSIAFQALLIEPAKPAEGAAPVELDAEQLTAAPDVVLKVVRGWVREGKAARVRTFKWTALENQIAEQTSGELQAKVAGMFTTALGKPMPTYADINTGVIFSIKPRITDKNDVLCDFIFNSSHLEQSATPVKADGSFDPSSVRQARAQTSINIPSGRSVVVSTREGERPPHPQGELLVISASVVDPHAPPPPVSVVAAPATVAAARESRTPLTGFTSGFGSRTSSSLLMQYQSADLGLTAEQKKKLDQLYEERTKLNTEMNEKMRNPIGADAARDEMTAFSEKRRQLDEKALAVLTPEQTKSFDSFVETQRNRAVADRAEPPARGTFGTSGFGRGSAGPPTQLLLESVNRSLERSPNEPRYLLSRAQLYASDEKWDPALADYRKVLELDPKNLAALSDLAAIHVLRRDEAAFRKLAEQTLERFGTDASPIEKLLVADACLLRPEWLANAAVPESLLQAAVEAIPEGASQPGARVDIAASPFGGRPTTAVTSVTSDDVLLARARLHIQRGQADEAIKLTQPFFDAVKAGTRRSRSETDISACCSLAIAQLTKGNMDAANAALAQARNIQSQARPTEVQLTAKVRLQRAEEILRDAGTKPAAK